MFARRASSSAVWKATSSRWSTTYCATSFCERENSSKRAEMYVESVWWPRAAGGMVAVLGMARRSFDGRSLTSSPSMQRLETRLDGLVLLAPTVHGDERGFFVETFRADACAAHGIPTEFVQDNHSRSRQGTLRGIHFQTHPGQGKLVRVRARPRARRRRRPAPRLADVRRVGGRRARRRARARCCGSRSGSGTGSCVLSEVADFVYKCTNYYDPATEAGIRFDDPEVGIEWPSDVELLYSERDADGAAAGRDRRLAAVHGVTRRPLRTVARPGVLHLGNLRTALLAWLFARSAGSRSWCGSRISTRAACGRGSAERAAGRPGGDRARLGRRGGRAVRARSALYEDALGAAAVPVYECFCTRAEIREAASAAHGPLPEGAYPGTCLRLSDAERAARRAERARRRRCGCAPAARGSTFEDRAARAAGRASSTTSSCAATTARSPTTSRSSSTTPRRASRRSCAGPTCRLDAAPDLAGAGARRAGADVRARAAGARAGRRRLAKRHGDVTLREVAPPTRVAWMAALARAPRRLDPGRSARRLRRRARCPPRADRVCGGVGP